MSARFFIDQCVPRSVGESLKKAGYQVAATYVSDTASAATFREETGIPSFQWDVADFDACKRRWAPREPC